MKHLKAALESFKPKLVSRYTRLFQGGYFMENLASGGAAMEAFREAFKHRRSFVSMEDATDGQAQHEIEHVLFGRLEYFAQLEAAASKVEQEQWNICVEQTDANAGSGGVRVRKTIIEGSDPLYELTTKIRVEGDSDQSAKAAIETTVPTTKDQFESFRFLCDDGLLKDRYRFPIVGSALVWEIDCFKKADGGYQEWVKIDLEVPSADASIPELPIKFAEVIYPEGYGREGDQSAKLDEIWKTFYTPNPYRNQTAVSEPGAEVATSVEVPNQDPEQAKTADEGGEHAEVEPLPTGDDAEVAKAAGLNPDGTDAETDAGDQTAVTDTAANETTTDESGTTETEGEKPENEEDPDKKPDETEQA